MKTSLMIFAVSAVFVTSGLAQFSDAWREQYFKAKYGRSSPMEEARQKAALANTAWRAETAPTANVAPSVNNSWTEQYFRAKYGRNSPMEEARQKAAQANTAWREETTADVAPRVNNSWTEQYFRAKYGRSSPMDEARLKAEREQKREK
ncbi:MAG: hypothetical protein R2729_03795 [Bryobacteraceae bacterium]